MKNRSVAELLRKMADLLELKNGRFKVRAYRRAARIIDAMQEDIGQLYERGELESIPGVGQGIAEKIAEYLSTGKASYYEKLKKELPVKVGQLTSVEGIGPRTVKRFYKELGIRNTEDLRKAAKSGRIAKLSGFGKRTENKIIESLERSGGHDRFLIARVKPVADDICRKLNLLGHVQRAETAGSLRRRCETVGDIDILVASSRPADAIDAFCSMDNVLRIVSKGGAKARVALSFGLMADLRVIRKESFGAALQYFTGSRAHNIRTRKIAISRGYKLSEYGLFKGRRIVASKTEKSIYARLGMQWIPPELREDSGEIVAAGKRELPDLVGISDIKGDLHTHTSWSEGLNSLEEMVKKAADLGYEYIAITDHAGNLPIANALDTRKLRKQAKEIDSLNLKKKEGWPRILKGAEVNIVDGGVDVADSLLEELDVVNAGLHQSLNEPEKKIMKKLTDAMENEHVDIIAHPSCRRIKSRKPVKFDLGEFLDVAKRTGTILEINSQPDRLDLRDVHAREARKKGLISISTDSHADNQMDYMRYGVYTARRAWCGKRNIINTMDLKTLYKKLGKR
jgi:DNA polymerase (family 10)